MTPGKLGRCTIAEATFLLKPGTHSVDRTPYRTSLFTQEEIDQKVPQSLKQDIIKERTRAWSGPDTIVSKAGVSPRFCVGYRNNLSRYLVRKTWPM